MDVQDGAVIVNTTMVGNTAGEGGAIVVTGTSFLSVSDVTVRENGAKR